MSEVCVRPLTSFSKITGNQISKSFKAISDPFFVFWGKRVEMEDEPEWRGRYGNAMH